jgi:intracellular sulfur oxidation DsrE/DsrF family protein
MLLPGSNEDTKEEIEVSGTSDGVSRLSVKPDKKSIRQQKAQEIMVCRDSMRDQNERMQSKLVRKKQYLTALIR